MGETYFVVVVVTPDGARAAIFYTEEVARRVCSQAAEEFGVGNVSMHRQWLRGREASFWREGC
jgi:TctA family transporter